MTRVRITDTTLRDGSHAMGHRFLAEQVRDTVRALAAAGVPVIEVAHGDGLAGSSFNYGFSAVAELDLIDVAVAEAGAARVAALLLPGVGTAEELRAAVDHGVRIVRVATHCTEADIAEQHLGLAREIGAETVGFLMMSHMVGPEELARQARIMADAGAQCVYVVDSAGALLPDDAGDRVAALAAELGPAAQVGFHGHNNLALGVANSIAAVRAGARQIDGATRALGAGAGNSPTEVLTAVFDRLGFDTGIDPGRILDAAQDVVLPYIRREPVMDRSSIVMGYAGVYSSFLLHAERAAQRYGVPAHQILREAGRRRYVGGQEDLLIDVAVALSDGQPAPAGGRPAANGQSTAGSDRANTPEKGE
ncbi:4-hydroxy-2-oxovalerate aldolase [Plantactinospora sp. KBS50]|uniref:4-hydroxy-2-oxovalerate aldolase n=1 Tax=Plantactinospora sp. KBS50 TaxID=2024580 RepID=UPI000BAB099D|nr:4-hydroxy-2-oxovalerate aldolase [Plantactinospora sp. KBS50]ASW54162.1 4-hydroxy-2-oxovalerate aldolase [Plantactinospora sp. KBS50]